MYLNFLNLTLSWPTKLFSGVNWRILWSRPQDWLQYYIICGYWHGSRFYCSMDKRCSFTWLDSDVFALNELDPHKKPLQQGRFSTFTFTSFSSILFSLNILIVLCPISYHLLPPCLWSGKCTQISLKSGFVTSCCTPLWFFNFMEFLYTSQGSWMVIHFLELVANHWDWSIMMMWLTPLEFLTIIDSFEPSTFWEADIYWKWNHSSEQLFLNFSTKMLCTVFIFWLVLAWSSCRLFFLTCSHLFCTEFFCLLLSKRTEHLFLCKWQNI